MGGLWSGVIESRRAQCRETRALEPLPCGQQHVRAAVAPIEYGVWAMLQKCDLPDFGPTFVLGEEGNHKRGNQQSCFAHCKTDSILCVLPPGGDHLNRVVDGGAPAGNLERPASGSRSPA